MPTPFAPVATGHMNGNSSHNEHEQSLREVQNAIEEIEPTRSNLASLYTRLSGGSVAEHEVGECLTVVRKALVRLRKARVELMQQPLPMN